MIRHTAAQTMTHLSLTIPESLTCPAEVMANKKTLSHRKTPKKYIEVIEQGTPRFSMPKTPSKKPKGSKLDSVLDRLKKAVEILSLVVRLIQSLM